MSLCACLSVLSLVWVSGCTPSGKGKLTTHEGPRKLQASTLKRGWTRELEEEEEEVTAKAVNGVGNRMLERRRGRQGGVYILLDLATTGRVLAERALLSLFVSYGPLRGIMPPCLSASLPPCPLSLFLSPSLSAPPPPPGPNRCGIYMSVNAPPSIVLDWKKIRSEKSLKKSNPARQHEKSRKRE
jgi:hypothetical protein